METELQRLRNRVKELEQNKEELEGNYFLRPREELELEELRERFSDYEDTLFSEDLKSTMKVELLAKHWHSISLEDIEAIVPEEFEYKQKYNTK